MEYDRITLKTPKSVSNTGNPHHVAGLLCHVILICESCHVILCHVVMCCYSRSCPGQTREDERGGGWQDEVRLCQCLWGGRQGSQCAWGWYLSVLMTHMHTNKPIKPIIQLRPIQMSFQKTSLMRTMKKVFKCENLAMPFLFKQIYVWYSRSIIICTHSDCKYRNYKEK